VSWGVWGAVGFLAGVLVPLWCWGEFMLGGTPPFGCKMPPKDLVEGLLLVRNRLYEELAWGGSPFLYMGFAVLF
jgi:hypothetical protein